MRTSSAVLLAAAATLLTGCGPTGGEAQPVPTTTPTALPSGPTTGPYSAEGGADAWYGEGIICDTTEPFELSGGGLVVTFTPNAVDQGTYSYLGELEGFAVAGGEAYEITYENGIAVSMLGWGVGSVDTPIGVQSDYGEETYTLMLLEELPSECE